MEEIYILSDGSQVDLSNYSQFEKTNFLIKNPNAKKQKGVAKSASVTSSKKRALNKDMESKLANGSLGSKKYRLATDVDLEKAQLKGIMPPPSAQPRVNVDNYKSLYDLKDNSTEKRETLFSSEGKVKMPGDRVAQKIKGKISRTKEERVRGK